MISFTSSVSTPPSEPAQSGVIAAPRLSIGSDACLWLSHAGKTRLVRPVRCFPWSSVARFISLRDEADAEHYLVEDPAELDATSRQALEAALACVGFVLEIVAVESITEDYEVRVWCARTRNGRRTFQTPLDAWPWPAPDGGYFVQDLAGDLFRLPALEDLDAQSRRCLWAYIG
jgi:hypothetical protein